MIDLNLVPECIPNEPHAYTFRVASPEITKLMEKHKEVRLRISGPKCPKTEAQNNTIHALIGAWWYSNCHSAPDWVTSEGLFKLWCKNTYGTVIEYVKEGKTLRVPISVADYTKEQLSEFIDKVKHDIEKSGALAVSRKLQEVFAGIEENKI